MEDKRNFIEFASARAERAKGREITPAELAEEFAKIGPAERFDHLDKIDADLRTSNLSVSEAAKFHAFRRALNNADARLRKIDR